MQSFITNNKWHEIYDKFMLCANTDNNGYTEAIGFNFQFNPVTDNIMSYYTNLFSYKKAAKMFFWYKEASATDTSIINSFPEYAHCIDDMHKHFNSNYGIYAYRNGGLKFCINELKKNHNSRRACFCINSNKVAINDNEIDKLCTNAIQFFIRDARLEMIVQMRSSNFITLLPYDALMFSIFYYEVYKALKEEYKILRTGNIHMQIASLHYYKKNLDKVRSTPPIGKRMLELINFSENIDYIITQLNKALK